MLISDIMTRNVHALSKDTSLEEAAKAMRKYQIGSIVVTKRQGTRQVPVGVLTDRDIVIEVVAQNVDPQKLAVGDVMSREVIAIPLHASLMTAVKNMERNGIRRLPVVDEKGDLCGIITADDIVGQLAEAIHVLAKVPGLQQEVEEQAFHFSSK